MVHQFHRLLLCCKKHAVQKMNLYNKPLKGQSAASVFTSLFSPVKHSLVLILLSFTTVSLAQGTKTVKKDLNEYTSVEYELLKSDPTIKNGSYKEFYGDSYRIKKSGFYKAGLKDSSWAEFDRSGKIIAKGKYKNDIREGVWVYFDRTGQIFSMYDFNIGKFTLSAESKDDPAEAMTKKCLIIVGRDTLLTLLDSPAQFLGGGIRFDRILSNNMLMPDPSKEGFVNGRSVISFTIDTTGHPVNFKIKEKLGHGCDEEAIRGILLTKDDWLPAVFKGTKVPFIIDVPVSFKTGSFKSSQ